MGATLQRLPVSHQATEQESEEERKAQGEEEGRDCRRIRRARELGR